MLVANKAHCVRKLAESGHSWKEIASKFNTTVGVVRSAASRAGYTPIDIHNQVAKEDIELARGLYEKKGYTLAKIAQAINVSKATARNIAIREGFIVTRSNFVFTKELQHSVRKAIASGSSLREIAKGAGVSFSTLKFHLNKTNWYRKRRSYSAPLSKEDSLRALDLYKKNFFMREIASSLQCSTRSIRAAAKRDNWLDVLNADKRKKSGAYLIMKRNLVERGIKLSAYVSYKQKCRLITKYAYTQFVDVLDPERKRGSDYHIDHRYSIRDGAINNVDPALISHPANLRLLDSRSNRKKSCKSSITLEELVSLVSRFHKCYGALDLSGCEAYSPNEFVNYDVAYANIVLKQAA